MKKFWILLFLLACGPSKEDLALADAAAVHDEAVEVGYHTSKAVNQLKNMEGDLDQVQLDSLQALTEDLSHWYELLVEVPGYDHDDHYHHGHSHSDHSGHDHDDHEGHDHEGHDHSGHDHGTSTNYLEGKSADEILAIQSELKKEVEKIQARVTRLLQDVKK